MAGPLARLLVLPLRRPLRRRLLGAAIGARPRYPYLSGRSVEAGAPSGTAIGTIVVPAQSFPRAAPAEISTDAPSGTVIGTIRT